MSKHTAVTSSAHGSCCKSLSEVLMNLRSDLDQIEVVIAEWLPSPCRWASPSDFFFLSKHSVMFFTGPNHVVDYYVLITASGLWGDGLCPSRSSSVNQGVDCFSALWGLPRYSDVWTLCNTGVSFHSSCLCWKRRVFCAVLMSVEMSDMWITEVLRIALMRHQQFCFVLFCRFKKWEVSSWILVEGINSINLILLWA